MGWFRAPCACLISSVAAMSLRLPDLVGRAMIDPEFLLELRRSPDVVLARFVLSEEEAALVRRAVERLDRSPSPQQIDELKSALLRRVST
jgi:hypothetical protein